MSIAPLGHPLPVDEWPAFRGGAVAYLRGYPDALEVCDIQLHFGISNVHEELSGDDRLIIGEGGLITLREGVAS